MKPKSDSFKVTIKLKALGRLSQEKMEEDT